MASRAGRDPPHWMIADLVVRRIGFRLAIRQAFLLGIRALGYEILSSGHIREPNPPLRRTSVQSPHLDELVSLPWRPRSHRNNRVIDVIDIPFESEILCEL